MSVSLSSCPSEKADSFLCISDKELSFTAGSFPGITLMDSTAGSQTKAECVLASHFEKPCGKAVSHERGNQHKAESDSVCSGGLFCLPAATPGRVGRAA